jgi:cell wall-associated NlpC family hydrolase
MTAPSVAPTVLASIEASIQSIQARIAAIGGPVGANGASAAQFAAAMSTATPAPSADAGTTAPAALPAEPATAAAAATGSDAGSAVVADASRYLGIPYVYGGESTSGMDCSGLVQKTFGDLGITLPRTAAEQQQIGTPVDSLADAQPGDLLFFGQPAYHVAIYAGNGQLIESPEPGKTVHRTDVYQTPTSIRRVVGTGNATTTPSTAAGAHTAGLDAKVQSYAPQFTAAERAYGLPGGLLAAVAQQESGGNPRAVSPVGAEGLMQLMPSTAAGLGVDAFDPAQAIQGAAKILSRNLKDLHGSVPLALAAYNAGLGAVREYGGIPPYREAQNYVRSITAMMAAGG